MKNEKPLVGQASRLCAARRQVSPVKTFSGETHMSISQQKCHSLACLSSKSFIGGPENPDDLIAKAGDL
jgi:hypothetical protein